MTLRKRDIAKRCMRSHTLCRTRIGRGYGPVVRETAWW